MVNILCVEERLNTTLLNNIAVVYRKSFLRSETPSHKNWIRDKIKKRVNTSYQFSRNVDENFGEMCRPLAKSKNIKSNNTDELVRIIDLAKR